MHPIATASPSESDWRKSDPSNAGWQSNLSVSYDNVGDVLKAQAKLDEALKAYRDSLAINERLAAADPSNAGWQRDLSVSYNKVGNVLRAQGDLAGALASYRASLAIRQRLVSVSPNNKQFRDDLNFVLEAIGSAFLRFRSLARDFGTRFGSVRSSHFARAGSNMVLRENRAHALMFLGRTDEAQMHFI